MCFSRAYSNNRTVSQQVLRLTTISRMMDMHAYETDLEGIMMCKICYKSGLVTGVRINTQPFYSFKPCLGGRSEVHMAWHSSH